MLYRDSRVICLHAHKRMDVPTVKGAFYHSSFWTHQQND